jgi:hypothetical protein
MHAMHRGVKTMITMPVLFYSPFDLLAYFQIIPHKKHAFAAEWHSRGRQFNSVQPTGIKRTYEKS